MDPNTIDLKSQLTNGYKVTKQSDSPLHLPHIKKNSLQCNQCFIFLESYEDLTGNSVGGIMKEQKLMINKLRDRFKRKVLSTEDE